MLKKLNDTFVKKKETFNKMYEDNICYIYERILEGGKAKCYEVFRKRSVTITDYIRKYDTTGKYNGYDTMELYPSDTQFGIWAWCYSGKKGALTKVEQLNKESNK